MNPTQLTSRTIRKEARRRGICPETALYRFYTLGARTPAELYRPPRKEYVWLGRTWKEWAAEIERMYGICTPPRQIARCVQNYKQRYDITDRQALEMLDKNLRRRARAIHQAKP